MKVSLKAFDVPLIPGASQAFTLQLLTQALALVVVVRTSLTLQLQFFGEALKFPLELLVGVLPRPYVGRTPPGVRTGRGAA